MTQATLVWSIWKDLLCSFQGAFHKRGFRRFAGWITALALNVEEHTITQSVLALDRPADWKALESFAEYGTRHTNYVTAGLTRLIEVTPGRLWHGYLSGLSTTPKSIAASPMFGAPAPSTSTPHAAPTAPPPSEPITELGRPRNAPPKSRSARLVPPHLGPAIFPQVAVEPGTRRSCSSTASSARFDGRRWSASGGYSGMKCPSR
jgi:hypothetical protein